MTFLSVFGLSTRHTIASKLGLCSNNQLGYILRCVKLGSEWGAVRNVHRCIWLGARETARLQRDINLQVESPCIESKYGVHAYLLVQSTRYNVPVEREVFP